MKKISKKVRKRLVTALCLIVLIPVVLFGGFFIWYYSAPGVTIPDSGITELTPGDYMLPCALYNGRYYSTGNCNNLIGLDDTVVKNLTGEVLYQLKDTDRLSSLLPGSDLVSIRGYDTDFRIAVKSPDGDPNASYFIVMDSLENRTLHRGADLLAVLMHANGNGNATAAFRREKNGSWEELTLEQKDLDLFLRKLMLTPFTEQERDYSEEHVQLRFDLRDGTHLMFNVWKDGRVFPDIDTIYDLNPCLWLSPEDTALFFELS